MAQSSKPEPARFARLSPSTDVVIYGPGRVRLLRGREAWYMDEREMTRLVTRFLEWERERRGGDLPPEIAEAVGSPTAPETAETAHD